METPVEIDFLGCDNVDMLRERIDERIAQLEDRYGRITACRIMVRGPRGRHRTMGHYEVTIYLTLPDGRQVDIERAPSQDERFSNPCFAIRAALRRARRKLPDTARQCVGTGKN